MKSCLLCVYDSSCSGIRQRRWKQGSIIVVTVPNGKNAMVEVRLFCICIVKKKISVVDSQIILGCRVRIRQESAMVECLFSCYCIVDQKTTDACITAV